MEIAKELSEARSFPGLEPPDGARPIGSCVKNGEVFYYFRDKKGNTYYETLSGHRFKMEMEAARQSKRARKLAQ